MLIRDLFSATPLSEPFSSSLELQRLLHEPLDIAADWQRAESLLIRAVHELPQIAELKVALYRMYAYVNRFDQSRALIDQVLQQTAAAAGFDADWRRLQPASAHWQQATGNERLYLYSMKALGFVSLRAGDVPLALAVLQRLQELDENDEVGGSVVYGLAMGLEDDD